WTRWSPGSHHRHKIRIAVELEVNSKVWDELKKIKVATLRIRYIFDVVEGDDLENMLYMWKVATDEQAEG
ncbi:hypothetical protein ACLOJK_024022, partial [Asimina triloba]